MKLCTSQSDKISDTIFEHDASEMRDRGTTGSGMLEEVDEADNHRHDIKSSEEFVSCETNGRMKAYKPPA